MTDIRLKPLVLNWNSSDQSSNMIETFPLYRRLNNGNTNGSGPAGKPKYYSQPTRPCTVLNGVTFDDKDVEYTVVDDPDNPKDTLPGPIDMPV